jgi:ATP-dependent Lon protease
MIIKSRKNLPLQESADGLTLPVLPLRSAVIFPGETYTIQMGRKENLDLLKAVADRANIMVLSFSPQGIRRGSPPQLFQVGVVAKIQTIKPAMANSKMVTIEGIRRISLSKINKTAPFIEAFASEVEDDPGNTKELEQPLERVMDLITNLIRLDNRYANELIYNLEMNRAAPGKFADRVGSTIHFQLPDKQELIEAVEISQRLKTLEHLLKGEIEKLAISVQINTRVSETMQRSKKESYLRQQMMEIRRELGDEFVEEDVSKSYINRIRENQGLSKEVVKQLEFEASRLGNLSSSAAEYGSTKNYIDLLLSLPWGSRAGQPIDLKKVSDLISSEYYGSSRIREQILEYLSVRQMTRESQDLTVLALGGVVGTGKASLVKAIATALNRQFVRINGTSLIAVEDIKGVHRSEIGAGPGQLIRNIRRARSFNLVIYLEDLEYVIESEDSNALLALMEAIDPRQNTHFVDAFVGIPIDLSNVLFVLGMSNSDEIMEPFAHRLEMVEMPGYIEREKILIAKKHILPKLYKRHGLNRTELKFSDKAFARIIRNYTMEAGLIGLQQQLEKIFRKVTRKKATCEECKFAISDENLYDFLGTPQFIPEKAMAEPQVGVANGLAWTGAGGDLMLIEGLKMRGTGQVITTGSLGEVMKESIQAAHSFVRARAEMLGIDNNDFVNFDIHIHFPMGAIPKDGPSAGVTVSLVVASVMAERPIRNDIAMTGEVTLRGRVLPVSGIKEKVAAAYRAGVHTIILPKENEKDIKEIPREIVRQTRFIFVETVDELFEHGLLDFTPSSYTLEKLFAEEIEKAQKRTRTRRKTKAAAKTKKSAPKTKKKRTRKSA